MNAIDLLLQKGMNYELVHQLVIFQLLEEEIFSQCLLGKGRYSFVEWEPVNGLFDLKIEKDGHPLYIEMKMWSSLSDSQISGQVEYINKNPASDFCYLLLGTSWFEKDQVALARVAQRPVARIGYNKLMSAIREFLRQENKADGLRELAVTYLRELEKQFQFITSHTSPETDEKLYFYGLYKQLRECVPSLKSEIYTVNNRGGEVYILNFMELWKNFQYKEYSGQLYYELVNGRLCMKMNCSADEAGKRMIRDAVRGTLKRVFRDDFALQDSGRIGTSMTACQALHDFKDLAMINKSIEIMRIIESKHLAALEMLRTLPA